MDGVPYTSLLRDCANAKALGEGKFLHAHMIRLANEREFSVGNVLVEMYAKCEALLDAQLVLSRLDRHDPFPWNVMMAAYARHGHPTMTMSLFRQMQQKEVKLDKFSFSTVLNVCSEPHYLAEGKQLHANVMHQGFECDAVVGTAILRMYCNCGNVRNAWFVFNKIQRDTIAWNAMIAAFGQNGYEKEALDVFWDMWLQKVSLTKSTFVSSFDACAGLANIAEGKVIHACFLVSAVQSDVVVGSVLVNMYAKCGSVDDASDMFEKMDETNIISWSAMVGAYSQNYGLEAIQVFQQMQHNGLQPNRATFLCVLDACAALSALNEGRRIHVCIELSQFELDNVLGTALLNMYGACGSCDDAQSIFVKICFPDVVAWNAMINVYAQYGLAENVLDLFQQMQAKGVISNKATFISVLTACSNACLADNGCLLFISMARDYKVNMEIEHYDTLIYLLARMENVDVAEDLINMMLLEPMAASWAALLAVCTTYSYQERGKRAAENVLKLDPENDGAYVSLSNIYAALMRQEKKDLIFPRFSLC